jgi:hypothetical protein
VGRPLLRHQAEPVDVRAGEPAAAPDALGRPWPPADPLPSGTRVIDSTPQAMPTSMTPAWTMLATMWLACCEDPHWQSTVVAATS